MPSEPGPDDGSRTPRRRHPLRATYRLQLHAGFDFDAVASIAGYLADLGVSHAYLSPHLEADAGSLHGYDVVNPTRVSGELGGEAGRAKMCRALSAHHIGQIIDIVPNHMATAGSGNPWWWDVLSHGVLARYANHFDIDWEPRDRELFHRVLVPTLPDAYGRLLERGEIRLEREGLSFRVRCGEQCFPISWDSIAELRGAADPPLALDDLVCRCNRDPRLLDLLLEMQPYRLAHWRTSRARRNYRRFFDIDSLIALRMDREDVFEEAHALVLEWLRDGSVDGVRVDHVDGLREPEAYLRRLAAALPEPGAPVFVEKILAPGETLPPAWPVLGTTGYDFLNALEGVFVDPAGEKALTEAYARFTGVTRPFHDIACDAKRLVLESAFESDVNRLVELLDRARGDDYRLRDATRAELRTVLVEYLAALPVYRTYFWPDGPGTTRAADVGYVEQAMARVAERRPELDPALLGFVKDLVLGFRGNGEFCLSVQELSGAAMAKGVEDTAFYRYFRLLSLNEVGSDPAVFGRSLAEFHGELATIAARSPETLLATSTHDTKRGEDVRARLDLLSEVPDAWARAVERWSAITAEYRPASLDPNDEYLFYQTAVGAYPLSEERAADYLRKAVREAKVHTRWTDPNAAYERDLEAFVRRALGDRAFTDDLAAFTSPLVEPGRIVSLAKKLIALTAPGIPDLYQGTELWDMSLVDPDNRRPVDFETRARLLRELSDLSPADVLLRSDSGLPKLWVVHTALGVRRRVPEAFRKGASYAPLFAKGPLSDHVLGFVRGGDVVTLTPRLVMKVREGFGNTTVDVPDGEWLDVLSRKKVRGGALRVDDVFARFPVALLVRRSSWEGASAG